MKTNYDVKLGSTVAIIGVRDFYQLGEKVRKLLKKHDINATLINPKYVAHLDTETLTSLMANHELVVTLEDNTLESGFGEKIASYYGPNNMKVRNYGEKKEYTDNESVESIYKRNHLLLNQIFNDIIKIIK